ncbi:uncharacterized protein LOC134844337 [Symsagittifera roscoffensis]|uniref:uncharacterized protein LOC134844337 n=1 Tax=Symsagittifera roscoffensis TaxID=84072 RepID=UPI00307B7FD5
MVSVECNLFSFILHLLLLSSLCAIARVSGGPTWYDCLKSAFYSQAKEEFNSIERHLTPYGDNTIYQCSQITMGELNNMFQSYFQNKTLMQSDSVCKQMDSTALNQQLLSMSQVFYPICHRESQKLFKDEYTGGSGLSVDTKQGFYDALGVNRHLCPDYEPFRDSMFSCNNSVVGLPDLALDDYLKNFCVGYRNQRSCYKSTVKKFCPGTNWRIPYDRTRVQGFEDVCRIASDSYSLLLKQSTLPLSLALVALIPSVISSLNNAFNFS